MSLDSDKTASDKPGAIHTSCLDRLCANERITMTDQHTNLKKWPQKFSTSDGDNERDRKKIFTGCTLHTVTGFLFRDSTTTYCISAYLHFPQYTLKTRQGAQLQKHEASSLW
jgi:hypothetical protein